MLQGGPVQTDRGFVLHSPGPRWDSTLPVSERLHLTTSRDVLDALARGEGPAEAVVALGYAGWDAGQLEAEMAALRGKHALAIIGCGWNRDADDPRSDGPVRVLREDRDEGAIDEVRGAAGAAWAAIQKLRAA